MDVALMELVYVMMLLSMKTPVGQSYKIDYN